MISSTLHPSQLEKTDDVAEFVEDGTNRLSTRQEGERRYREAMEKTDE